jgi:predicted RNA binding protein YcfA (HicA-like mRNA interferase family)
MTRSLRGVRGKEAIKAFLRAGGKLRPGKGGHINVKMPNGMIITLPGKEELSIGLLKAAIKKAGMSEDTFLDLL